MFTSLPVLAVSVNFALAIPTSEVDPVRILLGDSKYEFASLEGLGCSKQDGETGTRMTGGQNTV